MNKSDTVDTNTIQCYPPRILNGAFTTPGFYIVRFQSYYITDNPPVIFTCR